MDALPTGLQMCSYLLRQHGKRKIKLSHFQSRGGLIFMVLPCCYDGLWLFYWFWFVYYCKVKNVPHPAPREKNFCFSQNRLKRKKEGHSDSKGPYICSHNRHQQKNSRFIGSCFSLLSFQSQRLPLNYHSHPRDSDPSLLNKKGEFLSVLTDQDQNSIVTGGVKPCLQVTETEQ